MITLSLNFGMENRSTEQLVIYMEDELHDAPEGKLGLVTENHPHWGFIKSSLPEGITQVWILEKGDE